MSAYEDYYAAMHCPSRGSNLPPGARDAYWREVNDRREQRREALKHRLRAEADAAYPALYQAGVAAGAAAVRDDPQGLGAPFAPIAMPDGSSAPQAWRDGWKAGKRAQRLGPAA